MISGFGRRLALMLIGAVLALPAAGYAQEAVLTGTVTDSTGAVLPGVTVVAVNAATGNRFESVTDERGIYRMPARVGAYHDHRGAPGLHDRQLAPASSCWSARRPTSICRCRRRRFRRRSR